MAKKRGPKTKFTTERGEAFIRLARAGKTAAEIAEGLRVSRKTLSNWMRRNPELLLAVRGARKLADRVVEAALFQRASGFTTTQTRYFQDPLTGRVDKKTESKRLPPDTTAAMFWLRNRQPKRWREKNEGDVNVTTTIATLTDEQLDARIRAMLPTPPEAPATQEKNEQGDIHVPPDASYRVHDPE